MACAITATETKRVSAIKLALRRYKNRPCSMDDNLLRRVSSCPAMVRYAPPSSRIASAVRGTALSQLQMQALTNSRNRKIRAVLKRGTLPITSFITPWMDFLILQINLGDVILLRQLQSLNCVLGGACFFSALFLHACNASAQTNNNTAQANHQFPRSTSLW